MCSRFCAPGVLYSFGSVCVQNNSVQRSVRRCQHLFLFSTIYHEIQKAAERECSGRLQYQTV